MRHIFELIVLYTTRVVKNDLKEHLKYPQDQSVDACWGGRLIIQLSPLRHLFIQQGFIDDSTGASREREQ